MKHPDIYTQPPGSLDPGTPMTHAELGELLLTGYLAAFKEATPQARAQAVKLVVEHYPGVILSTELDMKKEEPAPANYLTENNSTAALKQAHVEDIFYRFNLFLKEVSQDDTH